MRRRASCYPPPPPFPLPDCNPGPKHNLTLTLTLNVTLTHTPIPNPPMALLGVGEPPSSCHTSCHKNSDPQPMTPTPNLQEAQGIPVPPFRGDQLSQPSLPSQVSWPEFSAARLSCGRTQRSAAQLRPSLAQRGEQSGCLRPAWRKGAPREGVTVLCQACLIGASTAVPGVLLGPDRPLRACNTRSTLPHERLAMAKHCCPWCAPWP